MSGKADYTMRARATLDPRASDESLAASVRKLFESVELEQRAMVAELQAGGLRMDQGVLVYELIIEATITTPFP